MWLNTWPICSVPSVWRHFKSFMLEHLWHCDLHSSLHGQFDPPSVYLKENCDHWNLISNKLSQSFLNVWPQCCFAFQDFSVLHFRIPLFHALILLMSLCLLLVLLSAFDSNFVIRLILLKPAKHKNNKWCITAVLRSFISVYSCAQAQIVHV